MVHTVESIVASMSDEQRKKARRDFGDALDIVDNIATDLPYSTMFAFTCSVVEHLEATMFGPR